MNTSRRTFLKILLIGGGTFVVGKILGPLFSRIMGVPTTHAGSGEFTAIEDAKTFSVYDDSGEEVLQIDKEG